MSLLNEGSKIMRLHKNNALYEWQVFSQMPALICLLSKLKIEHKVLQVVYFWNVTVIYTEWYSIQQINYFLVFIEFYI